jgi:ABC-2 type transport system ATP-binding protein
MTSSQGAPQSQKHGGPIIRIAGLHKSYGSVAAVRGVDLDVSRGETVALLGSNGAGKSTTVGMLLGTIAPDAGSIAVDGRAPRAAVLSGTIAAMMQDTGLMPSVTVRELVGVAASMYPHPRDLAGVLDLAGLTAVARRRADRLSGGQVQRLRFALVAVADPEIMVLDEPTRALDVEGRIDFWSAIRAFAASGRTVLFATHYLEEVDENASRVVVMAGGRIVADGDPAEVRSRSSVSTVRVTVDGDAARFGGFPGVVSLSATGDRVSLRTTDADATVRALVAAEPAWRDIDVSAPSLDESFLTLTRTAR